MSDHLPIFIIKKKTRETKNSTYVAGRTYCNLDMLQLAADLWRLDRENVFSTNDPNEIWHKLHAHYISVFDTHCPKKRLRVRMDQPSFLNNDLIQLMRDRDSAFKVAKRSGQLLDWPIARNSR